VDEWSKADPQGSRGASDIDAYVAANNSALDRYLAYGRHDCKLSYASESTITVGAGSIVCSNSTGEVRRMRANTTATTVSWSDIDTGSENDSTTYYLWAIGDADTTTFTVKISLSSTAPGSSTYYKRLGSFYNDADSNITQIVDDGYPKTTFGEFTAKSVNTTYRASNDGFVIGYFTGGDGSYVKGYTDTSSDPTTIRFWIDMADSNTRGLEFIMPVKKGNYWKLTASVSTSVVYWIPLE
jgi:hypothetical protein